jgi:transcriptional regulator GlxA family with amidase domain
VPHQYLEELDDPPRAARPQPRRVQRVIDAINDEPARTLQVTDLAAIAGTGVRSLQEAFRRHVGMSPMEYLQQVRLGLVRDALLRAYPQQTTVADVAYRWGFSHLGRFAQAYRVQFGVLPSETLRFGA